MAGSELLGNYWEESRQVTGKVVTRRQSYSRSPVCVWCMVSNIVVFLQWCFVVGEGWGRCFCN